MPHLDQRSFAAKAKPVVPRGAGTNGRRPSKQRKTLQKKGASGPSTLMHNATARLQRERYRSKALQEKATSTTWSGVFSISFQTRASLPFPLYTCFLLLFPFLFFSLVAFYSLPPRLPVARLRMSSLSRRRRAAAWPSQLTPGKIKDDGLNPGPGLETRTTAGPNAFALANKARGMR